MRYARKLALKFYRERERGDLDYEDFVSAAYLGLCDAARRFDPARGHSFQMFSHFRIRGAMVDMLRSIGSIPRTYFAKEAPSEVECEEEQHAIPESSPSPYLTSIPELTAAVNAMSGLPLQLHAPASDDEVQISYAAAETPEDEVIRADTDTRIRSLVFDLPAKERSIVAQYYFLERPFSAMAELQSGHTKSWLSRLHHRGLDRIRQTIISNPEMREVFFA